MLERKIRYDGSSVDFLCDVIHLEKDVAILNYMMPDSVSVGPAVAGVSIPAGSRTYAFYWTDRPYNVYIWRDSEGGYLGAYVNIVRNTRITGQIVSYEDLIIDLLVSPEGSLRICDEDELPEPLEKFEGGAVLTTLMELKTSLPRLLSPIIKETERF
jgi:Uncharacterized conserved protein